MSVNRDDLPERAAGAIAATSPGRQRSPLPLRVLVTGAGGQLGVELARRMPGGVELITRSRTELDITSRRQVEAACRALAPDLIINAAGCNAPARAELDPDAAYAVNADGAANLARIASQGPRLIHVSSAHVFDGEPSRPHHPEDAPLPGGVLGASKSEGEALALGIAHQRVLVLRTAWLYSARGRNCFTDVLRRLRRGGCLTLPADRVLTPTWAGGLARAIWLMAFRPALHGIHHWTDRGQTSWYEFARLLRDEAVAAGLLHHRWLAEIQPANEGRGGAAPLDSTRTWETLGMEARDWRDSLRSMVSEITEVACGHA